MSDFANRSESADMYHVLRRLADKRREREAPWRAVAALDAVIMLVSGKCEL